MNNSGLAVAVIAFDTTSRHSNFTLINFVKDWLETQGLLIRLTNDPQEAKANLFATIPAADGSMMEELFFLVIRMLCG